MAVSLRRVSSCTSTASFVPVFSFGEKELFQQYPNPPGSWVRRVQEALQARLSVALPLFHGRLGLLIPFRVPIHTVGESCISPHHLPLKPDILAPWSTSLAFIPPSFLA